jgi:hypothetical protein
MTTRKTDGRRLLQISLKPDFYELVQQHCRMLDVPMTIWARDLIRREIDFAAPIPSPSQS